MNIFASDRLAPSNIKFPKGFDKLTWEHVKSYKEYCAKVEKNTIGSIVLDSSASEGFNGLKCAKALTEITCDKHTKLPDMLVIGTNVAMKTDIQNHIAGSKRWIDLNRGK